MRKIVPRPHQKQGAAFIVQAWERHARGFLLADDVGVGKTITAWFAIQHIVKRMHERNSCGVPTKVLIVCPLSVVPHWERTVAQMGSVDMYVHIINYDRVKSLLSVPSSAKKAKRVRTKNNRIAREGVPLTQWDIVVVDESHKLKNPSQRTKIMSRVARYDTTMKDTLRPPFVIWMSATAGQNPTELSYLAPLLAQVTQSPSGALKDFGPWLSEQGFRVVEDPRWKKWTWTEDPKERSEDIVRMQRMLFARKTPVALRRLPTDIAGWPEINRILVPVNLTPQQRILYTTAWTEFRHEMKLAQKGNDPKRGMVARLRFRQKASLLRTQHTANYIQDLLDNNLQVAVSCQFIETLDTIHTHLAKLHIPVGIMDGRNATTREHTRISFQKGHTPVILFTPVEGFSLHQNETLPDGSEATSTPRALVVHDPRYSGIESLQIEGRTHRDGKAAHVHYMYSDNTVETDITRTLISRLTSTKALVGDDITILRELTTLLENPHTT